MPRPLDGSIAENDAGWVVSTRTPFDDLAEREDLLDAVEGAAAAFGDDVHLDVACHEVTLRILQFLVPKTLTEAKTGPHGLMAIGRRVLGLAILLRFCSDSCARLAELYGGSRASYSAAVGELSRKIGLPHPDRTAAAIEVYRKRAVAVHARKRNGTKAETTKVPKSKPRTGKNGGSNG